MFYHLVAAFFVLHVEAYLNLECNASSHEGCDDVGLLQQSTKRHLQSKLQTTRQGNTQLENVIQSLSRFAKNGLEMSVDKNPAVFPKEGYNQHAGPYTTHFQGVVRLPPGGARDSTYLVLTGASDYAAHFFVAKLASQPSGPGEFFGNGGDVSEVDQVVKVEVVDTKMTHAGGPAVWGKYLIVGTEKACSFFDRLGNKCDKTSTIHFYDMSDPENPLKLPYKIHRSEGTAGAVAITQQDDGKFLLMVGREDSAILDFYVSAGSDLSTDPQFGSIVATWYKKELLTNAGLSSEFRSYQNLNMVSQTDGQLFFVGTTRSPLLVGDDYFDLFTLEMNSKRAVITKVFEKKTKCQDCDFYAGASVYVDPPTSLLGYGINWNPNYEGQIIFNEFSLTSSSKVRRGECSAHTGASCKGLSCAASRGLTECRKGECMCRAGYCNVNGSCQPLIR